MIHNYKITGYKNHTFQLLYFLVMVLLSLYNNYY